MSTLYDVVVVGAGIEGSSTAYYAAKQGFNTLLLEQFLLPHSRGSSHGQTRGIRMAYTEDFHVRMMYEAYKMWRQLEQEEDVKLIMNTGLLSFGMAPSVMVNDICKTLVALKAPHEQLDAESLAKKYPFLKLNSRFQGVYDPNAGVMMAGQALLAFWSQFRKHGGTIHDAEPVLSITPGDVVVITTNKQRYRAKSVVLCPGPWASKLLGPLGLHLPLKVVRIGVYYCKIKGDELKAANGMPILSCSNLDDKIEDLVHIIPSLEYPNHLKIGLNWGEEIDPEERDSPKALETAKEIIKIASDFVRRHIPSLEPDPGIRESCITTMTPDHIAILDTHPRWKNIVVGAGFSAHGFKLAPVVGKMLTELATTQRSSFELRHFKMDRFANKSKL